MRMSQSRSYIVQRIALLVPLLAAVSIVVFVLLRLTPIDPVTSLLGGRQTSAEEIASIRAKFHLDQSPVSQYFIWVGGVLRGDFGISYRYQQSVSSLVINRLPCTLGLALLSSILAFGLAIPLGVLSAFKRDTWVDRLISTLVLFLVSSPVYLVCILAIVLITRFAPGFSFTGAYHNLPEFLQRIIVPSLALAGNLLALTTRVTRGSMIEQLEAQHIQTAVAKGLPDRKILWKHAFRGAFIPILTVGTMQIGYLIVGTVLVETVFSLPGLGSLLIDSIKYGDHPIVQSVTLLLVTAFLVLNLISDLVAHKIDPRTGIQ